PDPRHDPEVSTVSQLQAGLGLSSPVHWLRRLAIALPPDPTACGPGYHPHSPRRIHSGAIGLGVKHHPFGGRPFPLEGHVSRARGDAHSRPPVLDSDELDGILAAFEVESYLLRLVARELAMKRLD